MGKKSCSYNVYEIDTRIPPGGFFVSRHNILKETNLVKIKWENLLQQDLKS